MWHFDASQSLNAALISKRHYKGITNACSGFCIGLLCTSSIVESSEPFVAVYGAKLLYRRRDNQVGGESRADRRDQLCMSLATLQQHSENQSRIEHATRVNPSLFDIRGVLKSSPCVCRQAGSSNHRASYRCSDQRRGIEDPHGAKL